MTFLASQVQANAGEWKLSLGLGLSNESTTIEGADEALLLVTAPTIEVSGVLALTDYWQLGLTANWGPTFGQSEGVTQTLNTNLEGRFVLDALTWVPYLSFGVGGWARERFTDTASTWRIDLSVFGGFGLDYRPQRDWSIGFLARGHVLVTDPEGTIGPFDAQVLGSFYFD